MLLGMAVTGMDVNHLRLPCQQCPFGQDGVYPHPHPHALATYGWDHSTTGAILEPSKIKNGTSHGAFGPCGISTPE